MVTEPVVVTLAGAVAHIVKELPLKVMGALLAVTQLPARAPKFSWPDE
jgi:hypothetical protein